MIGRVISSEEAMQGCRLLWVEADSIAESATPGQFATVRCSEGNDPLLRRPLSIHRINPPNIAFLFQSVGRGTEWLAARRKGDTLDLVGALGKGFSVHEKSQNLLLVAGGIGIAPLVGFADQAASKGRSVVLLMGARTRQHLYPVSWLPLEMEVDVATEDGSEGRKGMATDRAGEFMAWADQVFACGPAAMYQSLACRKHFPERSIQVLLEAPMACGMGACYGCVVETRHGLKRICRDGPRFELAEII